MYDYNCPDCNEAKLQSDKNARKINEVIDQVNALIKVNNETVDFIEEKANEVVEEIAEIKVNEVLGDIRSCLDNIVQYDVVNGLGCNNSGQIEIGDIIQEFLNKAPSDNISLFFPVGVYKWDTTVTTDKTLYLNGERNNAIINNSGKLACLKHNGSCTINGLRFNATSSEREEFTVYSTNGTEFLCYDTIFSCSSGKINGLHIENTTISHIDRCKFNHSQISLKTWDCKITNTWVWALWRPYGIGIHGGCGNINLSNVDIVPPFRTSDGNLKSGNLINGIKGGIWINSEDGNVTNNIIMENIYLDGNPSLNTGVGILCENVFGVTISSFRANKMNDYPIIIDSCYNVLISKGIFYENNKLDLEKNEILIRKTNSNAKHDNITVSENHFINYKGVLTKGVPAIKVDDGADEKVKIINNNICQDNNGKAYGNIEIITPSMKNLYTNNTSKYSFSLTGNFVISSGTSGKSVSLPNYLAVTPTQEYFRFWGDNKIIPQLRVQPISINQVYIACGESVSSDTTIYYEVKV